MTGADLVARILKQEGVDFMGVIPFNSLEEAAAKAGIRPLIFRQERVGVNLADAYTRVTNGRGTGVFSMQAGPGAENAFAGVAQAYADSVPILLLPASAPRNRSGVHPTFSPSRTYESVVKWSGRIELPEEIPNALRRAFSQLRLGRPSPVLLELPGDILRGELNNGDAPYMPVQQRRSMGDSQDVRDAAKLLLGRTEPGHTRGAGRAVRRGMGRASGACGTYTDASDDLDGRQERVPRGPPAFAGHAIQHHDRHGRSLPRQGGCGLRHRVQLHAHALRRGPVRQQSSGARHQRRERREQGLFAGCGRGWGCQAGDAADHRRGKGDTGGERQRARGARRCGGRGQGGEGRVDAGLAAQDALGRDAHQPLPRAQRPVEGDRAEEYDNEPRLPAARATR